MFYSYNLLSHKKGKFAIIWLAATRGEKFLTKRDVNPVDLCATCDDIVEHISCRKDRISLYLSAQLTMGVCRVYRKKATYILAELQELYIKSLRAFQPDLTVSLIKKSPSKGKGRGRGDTSFTSRIDLHPTNAIPEAREDFGMLVLPAGIDPVEGPRGDGLPYLHDWVLSQIPSDSILEASAERSGVRDPNQARPEDITLLEDKLPAPNLLDLSLIDASTAAGVLDEMQLQPMNLEFFGPDEERLPTSQRRRLDAPEEAEVKGKRPRVDLRKEPKIIHVQTVVTVDVHPEPRAKEEPGAQDLSVRLFEEMPTSTVPPVHNILDESALSQGRVVTETPMEQQQVEGITTVLETQPGAVPETQPGAVLETQPEAVLETQPGAVLETQPGAVLETQPGAILETQPGAILETQPGAIIGDASTAAAPSTSVSVVISEQPMDSQLPPSSVERLLQQPPQESPRRRIVRRRRPQHLIVDNVTELARDAIRSRLVNDGRDLMKEIEFAPVRVLPCATWLLSHPANHNLGGSLQRLVQERMILLSEAPPQDEPRPKRRRKQPEPEQVPEKEKPRSPANLSDVERRRGGKDSFNQTPANVSDVSIQPNNSLMGTSIIGSSSHHQSMVLKPEEPSSIVEGQAQQQGEQNKSAVDPEERRRQEEEQQRIQDEERRAMEIELLQQQPQAPEEQQQQPQAPEEQQQQPQAPEEQQQQAQAPEEQQQQAQAPEEQQQQAQAQEDQRQRQEQRPRSPSRLKRKLFEESDVWRRLVGFEKEVVMWSELCPKESTSKKDAAAAFVAILEFTKKGLIMLKQRSLFGDITIVIVQFSS